MHRNHYVCASIVFFVMIAVLWPGLSKSAFVGPGIAQITRSAAEALKADDDAPCILEGHLEAKIPNRKDRYLFRDNTGKIVAEIKKKVFGDLVVTPQNLVRLEGEVDWSSKHDNEIEVDSITIIR